MHTLVDNLPTNGDRTMFCLRKLMAGNEPESLQPDNIQVYIRKGCFFKNGLLIKLRWHAKFQQPPFCIPTVKYRNTTSISHPTLLIGSEIWNQHRIFHWVLKQGKGWLFGGLAFDKSQKFPELFCITGFMRKQKKQQQKKEKLAGSLWLCID